MAAPLTGTLQMYLVLGALANRDVLLMDTFKLNSTVKAGRDIMYKDGMDIRNNEEDFKTFKERAQKALSASGFSEKFIALINWSNFQKEGVWDALKTLSSSLNLLDAEYQGPDCPCMSVLVKTAVMLEEELEIVQKRITS